MATALLLMPSLDNLLLPGRNEVVAKVILLHLSVILFTGGVCLSACWDAPPHQGDPHARRPPEGGTPPAKETPPQEGGTPCQGDPPEGGTPRQGEPLPQKEAPPPGRRHASYWNAFLFQIEFLVFR